MDLIADEHCTLYTAYDLICQRARCNFISLSPISDFLEAHMLDGSIRYLCKIDGIEENYIDTSFVSSLDSSRMKSVISKTVLEACRDYDIAVLIPDSYVYVPRVFMKKGTTLEQLLLEHELEEVS